MSRLLTVGNPPIQVKLRRSARARRLSLRISQSNGSVTLTLPVRVPEEQGIAFLAEKEDWLRRHLANVSGATSIARGVEIPFRGDMVMIGGGSGRSVTLAGDVVAVDDAKTRTIVADAEDAQTKKLKDSSDDEDMILDDDDVDLGDDVLEEDDDEDNVSFEELGDVAADSDDD